MTQNLLSFFLQQKSNALKITAFSLVALLLFSVPVNAQQTGGRQQQPHICSTMEEMEKSIQEDPSLPEKWRLEGNRQYQAYLERRRNNPSGTGQRPADLVVTIPIVFHIIDVAAAQAWITDRDIYQQVELLNKNYAGKKADEYKGLIPNEIFNRVGRMGIRFELARRTPAGDLTSGIERRVGATPAYPNNKLVASGGLAAWDPTKYVNVWCGTFTNGLLGIATFPFTNTSGAQGVTIGTSTLPFTSSAARTLAINNANPAPSYYPNYTEGSTLSHEIGHFLYLWHTFGDQGTCNNNDFRIQSGWPLPAGAGPEGDDTPNEKGTAANSFIFGNPSQNYSDGCASESFGMVYGSFMNYFDDRALFMFTDGQRKRAEGCLNLYRPGLLTSNGAVPPVPVTDAYLVSITPWGIPERKVYQVNNSPLKATIRNSGTSNLTSITVNVKIDAGTVVSTVFPLTLAPQGETTVDLGLITAAAGQHIVAVSLSAPNGGTDDFTSNDMIESLIQITGTAVPAPLTETFTSTTFPPVGWQTWNPNGPVANTWSRSALSGFTAAGAARFPDAAVQEFGTFDDLVSPPINLGASDTALLTFYVGHQVADVTDVSTWDGLEVYVSGDGGVTYTMAYKKSGNALSTIPGAAATLNLAYPPAAPQNWRKESIGLTPYIIPGKPMIIKFRNTCANGNNIVLDDINVTAVQLKNRDVMPISFVNLPEVFCEGAPFAPGVIVSNGGKDTVRSLIVNYRIDNNDSIPVSWTGVLPRGGSAEIALTGIVLPGQGIHTLEVVTYNPNGSPDQNPSNDTIRITFTVFPVVNGAVSETFETNVFPPAKWSLQSFGNVVTWQKTTDAAQAGNGSMVIKNFSSTVNNTINRFISPNVNLNNPDSSFVSFDYSYKQGVEYPGSTVLPLDTLEVVVTNDCGVTNTIVWKKWGYELQTENDPNYSFSNDYKPVLKAQWKNARIYLPASVTGPGSFQVTFISKANKQNNLYIDNINVYGKVLPQKLKDQGYLIYPTPFSSSFLIHHLQPPVDLQAAQVFNSAGQLVWDRRYSGNANGQITVDLQNMAKGVYVLKMIYTNKTIVERLVKN